MCTKDRAGQVVSELEGSGYVEQPALKKSAPARDLAFEERLKNWAYVVSDRRRVGGNCSSAWASDFIANRNNKELQLAMAMGMVSRKSILGEIEIAVFNEADRLDGWLIEAAWTMLGRHEDKQALRLRYVMHWSDEQIRQKLRIRRVKNVGLILARAKTSLQQVLDKFKNQTTIRSYNLTAGIPRQLPSLPLGGIGTSEELDV